jgi:aryl carrier-like protein
MARPVNPESPLIAQALDASRLSVMQKRFRETP